MLWWFAFQCKTIFKKKEEEKCQSSPLSSHQSHKKRIAHDLFNVTITTTKQKTRKNKQTTNKKTNNNNNKNQNKKTNKNVLNGTRILNTQLAAYVSESSWYLMQTLNQPVGWDNTAHIQSLTLLMRVKNRTSRLTFVDQLTLLWPLNATKVTKMAHGLKA